MFNYYDIDGNLLSNWPMNSDFESARIGEDNLSGDVRVSTIHLSFDHQYHDGGAPLIFETMIFGGEYDQWQCRYSTKENAAAGHKATIEWMLHKGPMPEGDYEMSRNEWEANR